MIGIAVALMISWGILYLFEKKSILSLGLLPLARGLKQLMLGFSVTAILCVSVESLEMLLAESGFRLNDNYKMDQFVRMAFWDLKSVVTEELIFRGALLFVLINRLGAEKGIMISAAAFGFYHWFSFGIFGNIFPMIIVFVGTGMMGYAWALAFYRTGSIFMPVGLHFGWNFTFNTIFSKGPLGAGLFVAQGGNTLSDWFSLVGLWGVPVVVWLIIRHIIPEKRERVLADIPVKARNG